MLPTAAPGLTPPPLPPFPLSNGNPACCWAPPQVLTEKMIEYVCSSGLYDCEFVKIGRGAVAAFAADRSDEAHVLRFSAESKHIFPAGKVRALLGITPGSPSRWAPAHGRLTGRAWRDA